jgi:hypothetical protein
MNTKKTMPLISWLLVLILVSLACSTLAAQPTSTPASTDTPEPTSTITDTPTNTPRPSPTPRPTRTPNLAATQRYEDFNAQAQKYFDLGYLSSAEGEFLEYDDFSYDWAQLGWYNWVPLGETVTDFYINAHFTWSSAYRNADTSGCGFIFAIQDNGDHYAVFLDRSEVLFLNADSATSFSRPVGLTRGTSRVNFDNPFDNPAEADFTLIVNGIYTYVLVNGEVTGEYTLAQSKILRGDVGLSILSGTNKDFGTRCEMTDIHVFIPN